MFIDFRLHNSRWPRRKTTENGLIDIIVRWLLLKFWSSTISLQTWTDILSCLLRFGWTKVLRHKHPWPMINHWEKTKRKYAIWFLRTKSICNHILMWWPKPNGKPVEFRPLHNYWSDLKTNDNATVSKTYYFFAECECAYSTHLSMKSPSLSILCKRISSASLTNKQTNKKANVKWNCIEPPPLVTIEKRVNGC